MMDISTQAAALFATFVIFLLLLGVLIFISAEQKGEVLEITQVSMVPHLGFLTYGDLIL